MDPFDDEPEYDRDSDDIRYDDDDRPDEDEDEGRAYGDDDDGDIEFAHPGGNSALRAATRSNPRIYPCPTCGAPNRLTAKDVQLGYQCDSCADAAEGGGY